MLKVVYSGGQRGADQGALAAAKAVGLDTGGWAPQGWRTLNGAEPKLALLGLKEFDTWKYAPRTYANVRDTDGTIRLAKDFTTVGEVCTLKAIKKFDKPYMDVPIDQISSVFNYEELVIKFINMHCIERINIAGNAGKSKEEASEIFASVRNFLIPIFRKAGGVNAS